MLRQLIIGVLLLSATTAIAQADKIKEKQPDTSIDYKLTGAPMPTLLLVAIHDTAKKGENATGKHHGKKKHEEVSNGMIQTLVTDKDVNNGANLFVMMFNPTCSHCEDMTALLEKNISLFKRSKVVLMATSVMKPYLPDFSRSFHIDNFPQMYVGTDSMGFIGNVFLYSALPQINVYDKQRKLLKIYTGEVAIDSLKQYIE